MKVLFLSLLFVSLNSFATIGESFIVDKTTGEQIVSRCLDTEIFIPENCMNVGLYLVSVGEKGLEEELLTSIETKIVSIQCGLNKKNIWMCESEYVKTVESVDLIEEVQKNNFYNGFPKVGNPVVKLEGLSDYKEDNGTPRLVQGIGYTFTEAFRFAFEYPVQVAAFLIVGTVEAGMSATVATKRLFENRKISRTLKSMIYGGKTKQVKLNGKSFRKLVNSLSEAIPTI